VSQTTTRVSRGTSEDPGSPVDLEPPRPTRRRPSRGAVVAGLAVVALFVGALAFDIRSTSAPPAEIAGSTAMTSQAFEAEYGMRFTMLGVVASGGLLDLRMTVVDPAKAAQLFGVHLQPKTGHTHGDATMPVLVPDGSNTVIHVAGGMSHHVSLKADQSVNLLFPNPGGAIQGAATVSLVIGDVRIDGITAQI
jgi:hypothetical protein